jgi:hypothetical protein
MIGAAGAGVEAEDASAMAPEHAEMNTTAVRDLLIRDVVISAFSVMPPWPELAHRSRVQTKELGDKRNYRIDAPVRSERREELVPRSAALATSC